MFMSSLHLNHARGRVRLTASLCLQFVLGAEAHAIHARATIENNSGHELAIECMANFRTPGERVDGIDKAVMRPPGYVQQLELKDGSYGCLIYPKKWPYSAPKDAVHRDLWLLGGENPDRARGYPVWIEVPDGANWQCSGLTVFMNRFTWFVKPVCGQK